MADNDELAKLAEALLISEERQAEIDLDRKRLNVQHSLLLHRDKASAADVKAMIAHLERAGMPENASLSVDGTHRTGNNPGHTRMYATWSTEPDENGAQ